MKITSAEFVKGVVGPDSVLEDGRPQIAIIGASNVGKSSLINSLTHRPGLAIASSSPGRTKQINVFVINKKTYFLDLPGYGYAKVSKVDREKIQQLIGWYLFHSQYEPKFVVLIIDAYIGLSKNDVEMITMLEESGKKVIIVANKIDKVKSSKRLNEINKIQQQAIGYTVIPYSSTDKIGQNELTKLLF